MTENFEQDPLTGALRASLVRHAADAPSGDRLTERIIAAADRTGMPAPRRRSGWRAWTLPIIAAASVGAVVTAVVVVENYRPTADQAVPADSHHRSPSAISSPSPTTPSPTQAVTSSPAPSRTALHHVKILDLTFANVDDGWALASADCIGKPGRCTALLRTTDGTSWHSMPGAAFNVDGVEGCADPCVDHLRFATDQIGYAFGPNALFMTTDGGSSWLRQPGLGAEALETLNGNVIRYGRGQLARAPIGSTHWTEIELPGGTLTLFGGTVSLARAGHTVMILLSLYNPAKGFQQGTALYRSTDDGVSWQRSGEPCPYIGAGYSHEAVTMTVGADGSVVIGCVGHDKQQTFFGGSTITSTDGGKSFVEPPATGKLGPAVLVGAADAEHQFVYAAMSGRPGDTHAAFYSSSGPLPWNRVPEITGQVSFIGFESTRVGRVVADGGRTIWTTRNAGATWSRTVLP